jgi:formyltetrahydrofolate hydrolase
LIASWYPSIASAVLARAVGAHLARRVIVEGRRTFIL